MFCSFRHIRTRSLSRAATFWNVQRSFMQIAPSVERALQNGEPVVALESTIVAHGMPFPENLILAQEVESILESKVSGLWIIQ